MPKGGAAKVNRSLAFKNTTPRPSFNKVSVLSTNMAVQRDAKTRYKGKFSYAPNFPIIFFIRMLKPFVHMLKMEKHRLDEFVRLSETFLLDA